ncbi:MAG: peptidoglycan-binding protein [Alphaproteobacteria bacterium]|nr:peptidoglycan-binding protein [Alphaproteobacteria bacterium]
MQEPTPEDLAWAEITAGAVVERGAEGPAVTALQDRLRSAGIDIEVDGQFGPKTEKAVRDLQASLGLTPDGDVGPLTSAALDAHLAELAAAQAADAGQTETEAGQTETEAGQTETEAGQTETEAGQTEAGGVSQTAIEAAAEAWLATVPESMRTEAEENLPLILQACADANVTDPNQVAYILATAQAETAFGEEKYTRSVALVEDHNRFTQNADGTWSAHNHVTGETSTAATEEELLVQYWNDAYGSREDLGNREGTDDGANYRGRGFVQLTGRSNYQAMTDILVEQGYTYEVDGVTYGTAENPIDLLAHPDHVNLNAGLAARILVEGSMRGTFTGVSIPDYVNDTETDFVNARRVINGQDRADEIAGYAEDYANTTVDWAAVFTPAAEEQTGVTDVEVVQPDQEEATAVEVVQPDGTTRETGPVLSSEEQAAMLQEIAAITEQGFGTEAIGRGTTDVETAKTLQRALVQLGYLPAGTEIDGKVGPITTNALMAFQVATSGVDTIEKGTNADGEPVYMTDSDDPRLMGIVTGTLTADTRAKLLAELEAQRASLEATGALPDQTAMRTLGDTPEQQAELQRLFRERGLDPAAMAQIDTAAYLELGLRPHVLAAAIDGWENAYLSGQTTSTMITVNDYELPANMRRSFTIDLSNMTADPFMHEVLAHGRGSDMDDGSRNWSTRFSGANVEESGQSVLGGLIAGDEAYQGSKRFGTVVEGIEAGINDNAEERLIRTHAPSAGYEWTSEQAIGQQLSYRSLGCVVWDLDAAEKYRDAAREADGLYLFNFAPHEQYWGRTNDVNRD